MKKIINLFLLVTLSTLLALSCNDDNQFAGGGTPGGDTEGNGDTGTYFEDVTINKSFPVPPGYDNKHCYLGTYDEMDFLACSLIALDEIYVSDDEDFSDDAYTGMDTLEEELTDLGREDALGVPKPEDQVQEVDLSELSTREIYDLVQSSYPNTTAFLDALIENFDEVERNVENPQSSEGFDLLVNLLYTELDNYTEYVERQSEK